MAGQTIRLEDVVVFQQEVLLPLIDKDNVRTLLEKPEWDWAPHAVGWSDLSASEAKPYLEFFGPAAFKIIRFTPLAVRKAKQVWVEGGACLISTADQRFIRTSNLHPLTNQPLKRGSVEQAVEFLESLPSENQAVDAVLIPDGAAADVRVVYVGEDAQFAGYLDELWACHDQGDKLLPACQKLTRRIAKTTRLLHSLQDSADVDFSIVFLSEAAELLREGMANLFESPQWHSAVQQVRAVCHINTDASVLADRLRRLERSTILYTYTQHWVEKVLRPLGVVDRVDEQHPFLIIEPFHHFSLEVPQDGERLLEHLPSLLIAVMSAYFQQQRFLSPGSKNEFVGVAGFLPHISIEGGLSFNDTISASACNRQNVKQRLKDLARSIEEAPLPLKHNPVFLAGVNVLSNEEEVREALIYARRIEQLIRELAGTVKRSLKTAKRGRSLRARQLHELRREFIEEFRSQPRLGGNIKDALRFVLERYRNRALKAFCLKAGSGT